MTELTRAVGLARLLCSLVNPLGHMGLVAHLRKETELCVRVADLYLFVCVCVVRVADIAAPRLCQGHASASQVQQ